MTTHDTGVLATNDRGWLLYCCQCDLGPDGANTQFVVAHGPTTNLQPPLAERVRQTVALSRMAKDCQCGEQVLQQYEVRA